MDIGKPNHSPPRLWRLTLSRRRPFDDPPPTAELFPNYSNCIKVMCGGKSRCCESETDHVCSSSTRAVVRAHRPFRVSLPPCSAATMAEACRVGVGAGKVAVADREGCANGEIPAAAALPAIRSSCLPASLTLRSSSLPFRSLHEPG